MEEPEDLKPDMVLEGVVTNVTNFGAFVDIGVHQDGLVHISALADRFVKDPHEVVKAGDIVKVKVLAVDLKRRRIALSMRLGDDSRDYLPPGRTGPRSVNQLLGPRLKNPRVRWQRPLPRPGALKPCPF